jgi:hypothetical protein
LAACEGTGRSLMCPLCGSAKAGPSDARSAAVRSEDRLKTRSKNVTPGGKWAVLAAMVS